MASDNRQPASFRTNAVNHAHQILLGPHPAMGEAIFVLDSGKPYAAVLNSLTSSGRHKIPWVFRSS
jgi:hypothetical protein